MRINIDSVRLAVAVGGVLLVVLLLLGAFGVLDAVDPWFLALIPLMTAIATYSLADRMVIRPLRDVVQLLHRVEMAEFGALPDPQDDRGDMAALQRAVVRTGRALEVQMSNLTRLEHYRKDYLGNVSHELKTPIFAIQGFAETLLDGAIDLEVRVEFVEKILRNAVRLDHLASDLAEIAKIESGELRMEPRPFALAPLVAEVVESIEQVAQQKRINVTYRLAENLPLIFADENRVRQVLLNLVDNGVKYTNEGGHVVVAARRVENSVRVTVSDSGIGILPEHLSRVTERFYRVDASRSRSQGGTGLGLAIVKHILSAHGSALHIDSKPGHGSTFSFSLPVRSDDDE